MKNPATTTTRKVLFVLYGTMLSLSVALITWLHNGQLKSLKHEAYARLGGITGTLAAQIDGGSVKRLLAKYDSRGMIIIILPAPARSLWQREHSNDSTINHKN